MCSFCNLVLSFCCNDFICESRIVSSPNLVLYFSCFCKKNLFFFRIKICIVHASSDITMVDHVFTFKADQKHTFSSRELSIADVT